MIYPVVMPGSEQSYGTFTLCAVCDRAIVLARIEYADYETGEPVVYAQWEHTGRCGVPHDPEVPKWGIDHVAA